MVDLARMGVGFSPHDIARFADSAGAEGGPGALAEGVRIAVSGSRKVITAKSEGQQEYLEAIERTTSSSGSARPAPARRTWPWRWRWTRSQEAGQADHPGAPGGRGGREPRLPAGRPAGEGGSVPAPLYDALEDMMPAERVRRALETRAIEIAPLAYMRGRTLHDAFVILDEAQNATTRR
jgi:phosphate starvation-inducible protein PhoH and related proteins